MRKLLRGVWAGLAAITVCLSASGCQPALSFNPQDLYSLPQLPAEYTELDNRIKSILESGAETTAPMSGTYIQPVQLRDLDGDGQEEAVAFFIDPADERPLKIYIFTAVGGTYRQSALIEGSGTAIYSITYSDLDRDGRDELVVGWRVSTDLQALSVYALHREEPEELMRTNYVRYEITDLDQDQMQELVVLRSDDEGNGLADYYCWQEGGLLPRTSARISMTMAELSQQGRVTVGALQNGAPALFVTGVADGARAITDILALKSGELTNIALSDVTGVSAEIAPFRSLYPTDINGDGATEVPWPMGFFDDGEDGGFQRIDWRGYSGDGKPQMVLSTYHSLEDGWYLCLPEAWREKVLVNRGAGTDETTVTFLIRGDGTASPREFLKISTLTGSDREVRAVRGNRFSLGRKDETTYVAELLEANNTWEFGVTENEVREAFKLTTAEWPVGDA